ncbi:VIER F-box protein 1 [Artemisia annua]|uniref:VIER F-box protein 1 n=1 Tax=Artemisia annua TaxID=35608 RepID=A0A2U1L9V1_ARTAN|nr:VIER F-box protein 1 [Artemisia annua]
MGQSPSTTAAATTTTTNRRRDTAVKELRSFLTDDDDVITTGDISILPDACLASVFQFLTSGDRKTCSLVSKRWLEIEGQSRHRLSLNAQSDLTAAVTSLFVRFDSVTKLSLKCDRRSVSINDDGLVLISEHCRNLTRLKLRACREITDLGMVRVSENLKYLKRFSCGSCGFGVKGMNGLIENCGLLEELSVKRLRGISNVVDVSAESVGPGGGMCLKFVCLKDLYNAQCFGDLLAGSKNLRTLKVFRCSGDWDKVLEMVTESVTGLVEVHLERLQLSDVGLVAVSKCRSLEVLHILKTPDCSNLGLLSVAENCRGLRKVHIDGWKTNRINDEGLVGLSKYCVNIQELVLIGVNCTRVGLEVLGAHCVKLERLALCGSETVGDAEISCIAEKCIALKKLCIKSCPVSDHGMEALAVGCPNLVKVKVKKCRGVTSEGLGSLRASREALTVNLDSTEVESQDAASEGVQDGAIETPTVTNHIEGASNSASRSTSRSTSFKARLGLIAGRSLVCTFRKWSSFGGSSSRSQ